jgi:hypothetical protein
VLASINLDHTSTDQRYKPLLPPSNYAQTQQREDTARRRHRRPPRSPNLTLYPSINWLHHVALSKTKWGTNTHREWHAQEVGTRCTTDRRGCGTPVSNPPVNLHPRCPKLKLAHAGTLVMASDHSYGSQQRRMEGMAEAAGSFSFSSPIPTVDDGSGGWVCRGARTYSPRSYKDCSARSTPPKVGRFVGQAEKSLELS